MPLVLESNEGNHMATTIITPAKPPVISQETLRHYGTIERAFFECREMVRRAYSEGRAPEPGNLGINVLAITEPVSPLIIDGRVADALRDAARNAATVNVVVEEATTA